MTEGAPETLEFRRYFFDSSGNRISPWHDIPLQPAGAANDVFNFICEIPKGTKAKMETNKETEWNPFIQDTKKGKLRFYHSDSLVNYGALPQTWEDGDHIDPKLNLKGDNDPLDVLEIGSQPCMQGDIYAVKVLGILGMIDGGEMDWKLVVIAASDPLADSLNDIGVDNKKANPSVQDFLVQVRVWFRDYKIPDGKPANDFAFNDQYQSKAYALAVVKEQHAFWKGLVAKNPTAATEKDKAYEGFWWHQ